MHLSFEAMVGANCHLPAPRARLCVMQFARKVGVSQLARRFFSSQKTRMITTASVWHHRNPYDIDEAGTKNLSDQSPLMSIDEVEHQRKRTRQGQEDAKDAAIKLLAGRPHTQKELRSKLLEKGFSMEVIKNAVDRLQELGLQSDREFAEVFVRSKWRTSKWGPAKLQLELSRRGVAKQHIDAAVQQQFGDGLQVGTHIEDLTLTFHPEDGGPGSSGSAHAARLHGSSSPPPAGQGQLGAAADPAGALLAEARRQFERSRGLSGDTRKRRLVGWLQRRGHRWEDISKILKQLEKEAASQALDAEQSDADDT